MHSPVITDGDHPAVAAASAAATSPQGRLATDVLDSTAPSVPA